VLTIVLKERLKKLGTVHGAALEEAATKKLTEAPLGTVPVFHSPVGLVA
jgi:hypothetical protein